MIICRFQLDKLPRICQCEVAFGNDADCSTGLHRKFKEIYLWKTL